MDLYSLKRFFLNEIGASDLIAEIGAEVENYKVALGKSGGSAPVFGANNNFSYLVTSADVRLLCESYLRGQANEWHLNYLANLIELSDSFLIESDKVRDAIFDLSSPEINGPINPATIRRIMERL